MNQWTLIFKSMRVLIYKVLFQLKGLAEYSFEIVHTKIVFNKQAFFQCIFTW